MTKANKDTVAMMASIEQGSYRKETKDVDSDSASRGDPCHR
jgi:hypothetical protein